MLASIGNERSGRRMKQQRLAKFAFWAGLMVTMVLGSCAYMFPNTVAAIYPKGATITEAGLGLLADIELWIEAVGVWIAFLFGG